MGELDFQILLEQYAGKDAAQRIPRHWRGGNYALYESKADRKPLLTYTAEWDSAESARDFFEAYRKSVLPKKWKKLEIRDQTVSSCAGIGDSGSFVLSLNGSTVSSMEGLPEAR